MNQHNTKKTFKITSLLIFFLFIFIYGIFGSHNLIFGVKIKKVNITDGAKIENSIVKVSGNAKNATNLTLNGREILINQAGDFDETIALQLGYNTVNITAKDKFGYSDEKNYKLIYEAGSTF